MITDLSKLGKAGNALRARLLPAGDAAHLHPGAGEADRRARGRLRRLRGPHPAGRPPGGEGAEDRRQDPDGRRPDRRQPGDRAADRGRAGGDPGLPREARSPAAGAGRGACTRREPGWRPRRPESRPARARSPSACPPRMQRFRATITTPRETLQQVLDPPQTDIASESYTIGGVQLGDPTMGLVTASQVNTGRFLRGGREALVSATYAARNTLKVGSKLDLNGTSFTVVGLVNPPLGGQGVDVYLPLAQLQKLSGQKNLVNVVLVRADDSASVAAVEKRIETTYRTGRGREREGGRRNDQRLARRRGRPLPQPRARSLDHRGRRSVPARGAARALVRRQARPRAGDAQGARLDAGQGRPPGRGRVARPRACSAASSASCSASPRPLLVGVFAPTLTASSTTGGREPLRRRAGRAHDLGRGLAHGAGGRDDRARRLRARRARRPDRRRRRRAPRRPPPPRRRAEDGRMSQFELSGVGKAFLRGSLVVNALQDVNLTHRARRVPRARRPERVGQDDPAAAARRARPARPAGGSPSRAATSPRFATATSPSCACARSGSSSSSST